MVNLFEIIYMLNSKNEINDYEFQELSQSILKLSSSLTNLNLVFL